MFLVVVHKMKIKAVIWTPNILQKKISAFRGEFFNSHISRVTLGAET